MKGSRLKAKDKRRKTKGEGLGANKVFFAFGPSSLAFF